MLEDAYRQNRMSTASAVRQLHSLHISAPIIGLVWANGTVRAHVDWASCRDEQGDGPVSQLSNVISPTIDLVQGRIIGSVPRTHRE